MPTKSNSTSFAKLIATCIITEIAVITGRKGEPRAIGRATTGVDETVRFSASAPAIIEKLKGVQPGQPAKLRGFASFTESGGQATLHMNLWGDGAKPGVEMLAEPPREPSLMGVFVGVLEDVQDTGTGDVQALLSCPSEYEGALRDCRVPLHFGEEPARWFRNQKVTTGARVKVWAPVHFAERVDEKYEDTDVVTCVAEVEALKVLESPPKTGVNDDFVM